MEPKAETSRALRDAEPSRSPPSEGQARAATPDRAAAPADRPDGSRLDAAAQSNAWRDDTQDPADGQEEPAAPARVATRFIPDSVPLSMREGSLLPTEDPDDYCDLLEAMAEDARPGTLTEFLSVKDAVDAAWEQRRLRRLRDQHITLRAATDARSIIDELTPGFVESYFAPMQSLGRRDEVTSLHEGWLVGREQESLHVEGLLACADVEHDALYGHALVSDAQAHARLDDMIRHRSRARMTAIRDVQRLQDRRGGADKAPEAGADQSREGAARVAPSDAHATPPRAAPRH